MDNHGNPDRHTVTTKKPFPRRTSWGHYGATATTPPKPGTKWPTFSHMKSLFGTT